MAVGEIRIIGGIWRGRKLKVPDIPDLRPTPNRIRETLFNWLAPVIQGARCLDAFAGSGALGFEALSRGASSVVMVDYSKAVIDLLKAEANILQATQADIYQAIAPKSLRPAQFDIVFLDPPFKQSVLIPCCFYLEEHQFLATEAYIYMESSRSIAANELPIHWELLKSKRAGDVYYHLALRKE